jgi:hypothetical protein
VKTITSTYYGATNTRGSRVVARDEDGHRAVTRWDSDLSDSANHDEAARALCVRMNWLGQDLVRGATKRGYVYVFDAPSERVKL